MSSQPKLTLTEKILATLVGVMGLLMLAQVVSRYAFNRPLSFSEEAARLLFVWTVFLGATEAFRRKAHVGIDILVRAVPGCYRTIIERVVFGLTVATLVMLLISGVNVVRVTSRSGLTTLPLPASSLYLAVPTACSLMLLHVGWTAARHFRKGRHE